eukprot:s6059_g3.t1
MSGDGWGYINADDSEDNEETGRPEAREDCAQCNGSGLVLATPHSMGRRRTATARGLPGVEALRALQ